MTLVAHLTYGVSFPYESVKKLCTVSLAVFLRNTGLFPFFFLPYRMYFFKT